MKHSIDLALIIFLAALSAPGGAWANDPRVRLGDQEVPREKFIVYVLIGNSNMQGAGGTPDKKAHPRAWSWDFKRSRWEPAKAPLGKRPREGGPAMPLLKQLVTRFPEHHFGVVKYAQSGVSDYQHGQAEFDEIVRVINDQRHRITLGGVMAMLGANEIRGDMKAVQFTDGLVSMAHDFRIAFNRPKLPIFLTRPPRELNKKQNQAMATGISDALKRLKHSAMIGNESKHLDLIHYRDEGYQLWGELAATLIKKNELLPTPAPLPVVPEKGERGTAVMITVSANMTASEVAIRDRLVRLGFGIRGVVERQAGRDDLKGAALVYASADAQQRDTAQLVRQHTTSPILSAHPYLARIGLGGEPGFSDKPITHAWAPPAAGLPWQGKEQIATQPFTPYVNPIPKGATGFARHPEDEKAWFAYGMDFDVQDKEDDPPRHRRAHLGVGYDGAALFNERGWQLFDRIIEWMTAADTPPVDPAGVPGHVTWPTKLDEVIVLWEGVAGQSRIRSHKGERQPLSVEPLGKAWAGRHGQMHLDRGRIVIAKEGGQALERATGKSGELTLEIVFTPSEQIPREDGWIFRWSEPRRAPQLGLQQEGRWLVLQIGRKQRVRLAGVHGAAPHHLVVTLQKETGRIHAWLNGQPRHIVATIDSRRWRWKSMPLILGGSEWTGSVSTLALHQRALSAEAAKIHAALWMHRLAKRKAPPQIRIRAKLVSIPEIDEKPELYPNLLAECVYEVQKVIKGQLKSRRIIVRHWATLNGAWVDEFRRLKKGNVVDLTVSPAEANPQIRNEQVFSAVSDDSDLLDLPVFYDPVPNE